MIRNSSLPWVVRIVATLWFICCHDVMAFLSSSFVKYQSIGSNVVTMRQQQQQHPKLFMAIMSLDDDSSSTDNKNNFKITNNSISTKVAQSRRNVLVGLAAAAVFLSGGGFITPTTAAFAATTTSITTVGGSIQYGDGNILMSPKEHGTSHQPVQSNLLYGVSNKLADQICNYNRHFAEPSGYFVSKAISTNFEETIRTAIANNNGQPITFYDSVTGKPLFVAPIHRSIDDFLAESKQHGWPSFRDDEVVWSNVRVLRGLGETVSIDGTHLGHNIPDGKGNRYCINLVSIAGQPTTTASISAATS